MRKGEDNGPVMTAAAEERGAAPSRTRILILMAVSALIIIGGLFYNYRSVRLIIDRYEPQMRASLSLSLEVTTGHFRSEEILSGDRHESMQAVWDLYRSADRSLEMMLDGGTGSQGAILPLADPGLRKKISAARQQLRLLQNITERRYKAKSISLTDSSLGQESDRVFRGFTALIEQVRVDTKSLADARIRIFHTAPIVLLLIGLAMSALAGFVFLSYEKRRREDFRNLRDAKEAVEESEEKYRLLGLSSSDWIYWRLGDGSFRYVSPSCEEITGYSPEQFVETPELLRSIVYPEDRHLLDGHFHKVHSEGIHELIEYRIVREDGEVRWLSHACRSIFDSDGVRLGSWGSNRDITDRKKAEKERARLEERIQHTQKLESLGVLAGGIAHDFNNLLMGILGNADLSLMEMAPEAPGRQYVKEIETTSLRAAELTNQMLAYSGKGKFVIEVIDLNRLVEEMGQLLKTVISKRARIKLNLGEGLPSIKADGSQIRQLVMNLITNASDAIGDKNGVITVSTGHARMGRSDLDELFGGEQVPEGDYVHFEVSDNGCGMDAETAQRIFDPFFTTKSTGRGLGLAAVQGIVLGHSGAIKTDSEPGRGTTFRILFPACESPDDTGVGEDAAEGDAGPEIYSPAGGMILFADDEKVVRDVGCRVLEKHGYRVMVASDGQEAVDLFTAHKGEVIAVILDMTMPRLSGIEAFSAIRRVDPGARVILSSGYSEMDVTNLFADKGLAGFLQKPYKAKELLTAIGVAIG